MKRHIAKTPITPPVIVPSINPNIFSFSFRLFTARYGGLGFSPKCVWISKRYACKTSRILFRPLWTSRFSESFVFLDFAQPIQCGTDDMESVSHADLRIHRPGGLFSAEDHHPAPP